jgi:hypothetical protein
MTGNNTYPGVGCCLQNGKITVHDGTAPTGPKQILFTDLVGQPCWIDIATIQIKTVLRGDLAVNMLIKLPPTPVIITADAQSGNASDPALTFQGVFRIKSLRHIGNSRNPDGSSAWCTVIESLQESGGA